MTALKNNLRLFAAAVALVLCASFRAVTNDNTCHVQLFKESTEGKWTDLESFDLPATGSCIPLDYNSYYTLRITDMQDIQAMKRIEAVIGANHRPLSIDLAMALAESKDAEDYFTELPLAYVSCTQHLSGRQMIYTLQIKTKDRNAAES